MHLVNIGLVHWHLFPLLDIAVEGPVIGISGENKSGKSTILDAIQTVMTGGDQKVMNLNRAATEGGRGAHRRTLQAYCLGRLSADDVRRQASSTTIVLAFRDPAGVLPPVSLGISLEAELADNTARVVSRFIARGVELHAADIVRRTEAGIEVEPWGDTRRRLEPLVIERGGSFAEYRDTAREFVREYMFALFQKGRGSTPHVQYLRSFVNAIAFREMDSANDFVRTYLLEEEPIQVLGLRRSIQVYRDADRMVKELKSQLESLKALRAQLEELASMVQRADQESWIALRARASAAVHLHNTIRRRLRKTEAAIVAAEAEQARCRSEIERIGQEVSAIQLERSAALSEERQALLKREIELLDRDLDILRKPLVGKEGASAAIRGLAPLRVLVDLAGLDAAFFDLVDEADGLLPSALEAGFPAKPERLDEIVQRLLAGAPALLDALAAIRRQLNGEEAKLAGRTVELTGQIDAAREGRIVLSGPVQAMVARLSREGMKPRVLAEMVDIADGRWASAAEGFLGIDREAIFVAPEHCHPAIDILSRDRAQYRRVRIANTRKLGSMPRQAQRGTLASVFRTTDALAEAFLVHRTGGIKLAASKSDFDRGGRWILEDGTYDDGVMVDVKEPRDGLKLGAKGIEASAAQAARERDQVLRDLKVKRDDLLVCDRWIRQVTRFAELMQDQRESGVSFSTSVASAGVMLARIEELREAVAGLASADVSGLDRQLTLLRGSLKEARQEETGHADRLKKLYEKKGDDAGVIGRGEGHAGSRLNAQAERWRFRQGIVKLAVADPIRAYNARRSTLRSATALADDAAREAASAREEANDLQTSCHVDARACLAALDQADLFGLRPSLFDEISPWVREQIEEIEKGTLVDYEAELDDARRKTNDIFRNSFANELAARFSKVEAELRDIREVLRRYNFLDERYSFRSQRAPGYEAFHAIVDRLHQLEAADLQLFKGDISDDQPLAAELRIVESVLLADDVDIERYEDYRRYFTFELEITSISSNQTVTWSERKGTASGGETQTPYYVALLSALSSVYFGSTRARSADEAVGLCLVAFDEAFSKLDETVRYEMVSFCRDLGLQLLICGPDGGRQSMERYAYTIVDVWRRNKESYALSDVIKQRTRDELRAINPASLSRVELLARFEQQQPAHLVAAVDQHTEA